VYRLLSSVVLVSVLAGAATAETVERILAVVDESPVFLSEVRLLARVQGVAEADALDALIDERLMFREASRLPQAALTAGEEERAVESVRPRIPNPTAAEEADVLRLARREALIVKYVEFRFRPQVRVSDDEVRAAWSEEHPGRVDEAALEAAAPALRERLTLKALDALVEGWVKELRQRAKVRYNRASAS
jgi:hypothetical protein